jgi:crossover junction endodeoxyribonuclease RusA
MAAEPLLIELSWPAKELSPNVSVHHMVLSRFRKAAKTEAGWATKMVRPFTWGSDGPFEILVRAYPPEAWRTGDDDNLIARLKSHFDGIAEALGVNDRQFKRPIVEWCDRTRNGKIVIRVKPVSTEPESMAA